MSETAKNYVHWNWKGGRQDNGSGYALVLVGKEHPMAKPNGYCYEHRLVMAERLGRMLTPEEQVHHINGDKADNRPENLELFANAAEHSAHHAVLRTASSAQTVPA